MIAYSWHATLGEAELRDVRELVATAVAYDAEAGFSTATPDAPSDGAQTRHLLVTILPVGQRGSAELDALPDVALVAYLRYQVADDIADVQLVVRPEFRSHGIATLLLERLDAEPEGWTAAPPARRLRAWSHGSHPAADRIARRIGGLVQHGLFKTLHLIGGSRRFVEEEVPRTLTDDPSGPAEIVRGHEETMAPAERATLRLATTRLRVGVPGSALFGVAADAPAAAPAAIAIEPTDLPGSAIRLLLTQALLATQDTGARIAQLYVDALADDFVRETRLLGFEHDQTDLLYVLDR